MLSCVLIKIVKILLPSLLPTIVAAAFGYFLLRRLEEIKSEVARHSDFSRKWAELFFDASNAFMISVERIMALFSLLTISKNPNDEAGTEWAKQANSLYPALVENNFRIQRLVALAPSRGQAAAGAADRLYQRVVALTGTKTGNVAELRSDIDAFNRAAREAHSEMIASKKSR